jgi:hypothetical protein
VFGTKVDGLFATDEMDPLKNDPRGPNLAKDRVTGILGVCWLLWEHEVNELRCPEPQDHENC